MVLCLMMCVWEEQIKDWLQLFSLSLVGLLAPHQRRFCLARPHNSLYHPVCPSNQHIIPNTPTRYVVFVSDFFSSPPQATRIIQPFLLCTNHTST